MARGIDLSELIATYSNPDPRDPYRFNGTSLAPKRYDRAFSTSDDVINQLAQAKITRQMTDADVCAAAHVDMTALESLTTIGKGSLDEFMAVTKALGIQPVSVPVGIILGV